MKSRKNWDKLTESELFCVKGWCSQNMNYCIAIIVAQAYFAAAVKAQLQSYKQVTKQVYAMMLTKSIIRTYDIGFNLFDLNDMAC